MEILMVMTKEVPVNLETVLSNIKQRKKTNQNGKIEWSLQHLNNNNEIHFLEVPEGQEKEYVSGKKILEEILTENIRNFIKNTKIYSHKS